MKTMIKTELIMDSISLIDLLKQDIDDISYFKGKDDKKYYESINSYLACIKEIERRLNNYDSIMQDKTINSKMTFKQKLALRRVYKRHCNKNESYKEFIKNRVLFMQDYIGIKLDSMFLGIEKNGYTHS